MTQTKYTTSERTRSSVVDEEITKCKYDSAQPCYLIDNTSCPHKGIEQCVFLDEGKSIREMGGCIA